MKRTKKTPWWVFWWGRWQRCRDGADAAWFLSIGAPVWLADTDEVTASADTEGKPL